MRRCAKPSAPPGTSVCVAVPSGAGVTGLSIRETDWRGIDGTATDLAIQRPIGSGGAELSLTTESSLTVTPTQLYLGINTNSTSTTTTPSALVAFPRSGSARGDLLLVTRLMIGEGTTNVGEAIFSVEETATTTRLLRLIDEALHVAAVAVADGGEILAGADQSAQPELRLHRAPMRLHVGDGGDGIGELCEIGRAPDLLEETAIAQPARHRDDVDGVAVVLQRQHRLEDALVRARIEMLRAQELGGSNRDVLRELLGLSDAEIDALEAGGVLH